MRNRPPPHVDAHLAEDGHPRVELRQRDRPRDTRFRVPLKDTKIALKSIKIEVELGFDPKLAFAEAQRCLNCDVQTVFADKLCIECDACVDICPMDCITFTANGDEAELRAAAARAGGQPRRRISTCPARSRPAA